LDTETVIPGHKPFEVSQIFPSKGVCTIEPKSATIVITGSIYLVAEIYERILHDDPQGQQILQD
jgi:hypothetical protein